MVEIFQDLVYQVEVSFLTYRVNIPLPSDI
jgi:hypothetical protein